jgi:uncharacterized iron-regulated protein
MKILRTGAVGVLLGTAVAGCAAAAGPPPIQPAPEALYYAVDARSGERVSIEILAERVRSADVVLFGEYHDDAVAHRIQLELVERLAADSADRVLGMEMFERDVQRLLDDYVDGRIEEAEFRARSRPWSNYAVDYKPLVDAAIAGGWPIAATNLPQAHATSIARYGLASLASLGLDERRTAAAEFQCPEDDYWVRFLEAMDASIAADSTAHANADPLLVRTYEAQCARDETMAETIAAMLDERRVLHINGAFHSDYHLGIVPRILRRAPDAEILVISAMTVADLADPPVAEHRDRADFVIFTSGID